MKILLVIFIIAKFAIYHVEGEAQANVEIVSKGNCGNAILAAKGINITRYRPRIQFDPHRVRIEPRKPKVPGCFRLIASNVTIKDPMKQITAEFEMRISGSPDPTKPTLKCKQNSKTCGCGSENACMYCDFCKNIRKFIGDATINNKAIDVSTLKQSCDCDIPPDTYEIDVEVCTPDEEEIAKMMPSDILNYVSEGQSFSMFTTLFIYNFRYNSLTSLSASAAAKKALDERKIKGLMGCYVIGTNVDVQS